MKTLLDKLGFDRKTFFRFILVVSNSQLIYAFINLRSVLYDPFLEALGVSNTEFGILMGFIGFISTFGGAAIGWLQDSFSIRNVLGVNTLMYGTWGMIMTLWPGCPFSLKCLFFIAFGFNADAMYWATVLKSVRTLAKEDHQATAFGMLESGRGICNFIVCGLAVAIYSAMGSTVSGMRIVMAMSSAITLLSGISIFLLFPYEPPVSDKKSGNAKMAFSGFLKVLRIPEVWMTGLAASCVYASFCAVNTYFVPYLQNVYLLPAVLVGIFGLVNSSTTRIIGSPIAGMVSDMKFKSSAHMMRACYCVLLVTLIASLLLPKRGNLVIPAMIILMIITVFCYLIRGVYYAPIGELGVSKEISAAAMAVAACIGYSPSFWAYPLFGFLIDRFESEKAYSLIFVVMIIFSVLGIILTTMIGRKIVAKRQNAAAQAE